MLNAVDVAVSKFSADVLSNRGSKKIIENIGNNYSTDAMMIREYNELDALEK